MSEQQSAPLVSVLIPAYNAGAFIAATLESVLSQTWPNTEVIVVDDGSRDDTRSEVARFVERGVRLISQANSGAASARNKAYAASSGAYIQFLDADDLISEQKIEQQVHRLRGCSDAVASCSWGRFHDTISDCVLNPEPVWRDMTSLDWIMQSRDDGLGMMFPALWLIPRAVAERAGPWCEDLSLFDDTEYFTRVLLASENVLFCSDVVAYYRSAVPNSLSSKKSLEAWKSAYHVNELCEAHLLSKLNDDATRKIVSRSWQQFAFSAYLHCPHLADEALSRAYQLSGARIVVPGGFLFKVLASTVGWKSALRIQALWHGVQD